MVLICIHGYSFVRPTLRISGEAQIRNDGARSAPSHSRVALRPLH
jgi:hypothetical protein